MMDNTKSLHDDKVESLIKKYRDKGFTVIQNPKADQLPFNLDNYQPDILATQNQNKSGLIGLIIEVKTSISPVSVEHLQSVAKEVSRHPGWRFLLVTLEDIQAESLPGTSEELPSWEELIDHFSQVSELIENNNIEPAFLFLWSVFEGALRKKAVDVSIPTERLPAIRLLRSMYSFGELSISQFDIIQACFEERNRLAHGYIQKLNLKLLGKFLMLVIELLREWIPTIHKSLLDQRVGLTNNFNDFQHLIYEDCDLSTESNNQQLKKNQIVLLNKAQIAIDALPTQEQEKISHSISCLKKFPYCSPVQFTNLSSVPNYFIATVGIYRIIFEFQFEKVTIIDIVNFNRIEVLYGSLEN